MYHLQQLARCAHVSWIVPTCFNASEYMYHICFSYRYSFHLLQVIKMCASCVSDISLDETKLNSHCICKCFRASDETHSRYSDTLRLQLVLKLPCIRFNSYSNTVIYWSAYWLGPASPKHRHSKHLHMYYKSEKMSSPHYNTCYNKYLYITMTFPHVQFISYPLPLADLWALPELGPALWLLFWRMLHVAKW